MSLYDNANIVFIPSAYTTSVSALYCPRPVGFNLTFIRNGNAWRIKSDGYMEEVSNLVPRFDYRKSSCPALLQEPQSTNLFNWSENYGYQWQKNNVTATQTTDVKDLFGNNKAIKLQVVPSGGWGYATLYKPFTPNPYSWYTFSKFVRKGSTNWIKLQMIANNGTFYSFFDLENGLKGETNLPQNRVFIEEYPNGWYRCSIATYYSNASGTYNCSVRLAEADGDDYIPLNAQTYIYAFGGQVEKTSGTGNLSPTSYIPTLGDIVTRNAETTEKLNVSNYINSKKGVLYGEYAMDQENLYGVLNRINLYGTDANISIGYYAGGGNQIRAKYVKENTVYDTIGRFEGNETEFIKVAFRWKEGLHTLYVNGEKIAETTPPSSAVYADDTLQNIKFGQPEGALFNGHIKEFMVFDDLLSDSQMNELTRV